jgi:hypothetical protein
MAAEGQGVPFSVDSWLGEHQAAHGAFSEEELRALASEAGVPYVGPTRADRDVAAPLPA